MARRCFSRTHTVLHPPDGRVTAPGFLAAPAAGSYREIFERIQRLAKANPGSNGPVSQEVSETHDGSWRKKYQAEVGMMLR